MSRPLAFLVLSLARRAAAATDFYVDPINGATPAIGSAGAPGARCGGAGREPHRDTQLERAALPAGATLVTINAGAPVKAGDTLWCAAATTARSPSRAPTASLPSPSRLAGHVPPAQPAVFRAELGAARLSISLARPSPPITIVSVRDDGYFGPAWDVTVEAPTSSR
jgi:hypothetical protein